MTLHFWLSFVVAVEHGRLLLQVIFFVACLLDLQYFQYDNRLDLPVLHSIVAGQAGVQQQQQQ